MTPPTNRFYLRTPNDPPHPVGMAIGHPPVPLRPPIFPSAPLKAFPRGPRCSALPVAEEAEHKRVQRSVGNAAASAARRPQGTANG